MYQVLVVEDEQDILEGIVSLIDFPSYGFDVIKKAQNGAEALKLIEQRPPELLITDIKMPVMDGMELIERVKHSYPDMAIVVLTGYDDFQILKRIVNLNITGYISKITMFEDFPEMLKKCQKLVEKPIEEANLQNTFNQMLWELSNAIEAGNYSHIHYLTDHILDYIFQTNDTPFTDILKKNCNSLLWNIIWKMEYLLNNSEQYNELKPVIAGIDSMHNPDEIKVFTQQMISDILKPLTKESGLTNQEQIRLACKYIDSHIFEKINIQTMADYCCTTESYFSTLFKKHTGVTFSEYTTRKKMEKAHELLQSGLNVAQVADMLGYAEIKNFRANFKRHYNINPTQVPKQYIQRLE